MITHFKITNQTESKIEAWFVIPEEKSNERIKQKTSILRVVTKISRVFKKKKKRVKKIKLIFKIFKHE